MQTFVLKSMAIPNLQILPNINISLLVILASQQLHSCLQSSSGSTGDCLTNGVNKVAYCWVTFTRWPSKDKRTHIKCPHMPIQVGGCSTSFSSPTAFGHRNPILPMTFTTLSWTKELAVFGHNTMQTKDIIDTLTITSIILIRGHSTT